MNYSRRVTVADVARLAGLSTASVSRALSGARPVRPDVAERVWQAAEQLGYRPDAVARSLRTRATQTLGLVVADIVNPFFPALVKAVEQECRHRGLSVLLADAGNDVEVERKSVEVLLDKRIDTLLISPSHRFLSKAAIAAAVRQVHVVQLDRVADETLSFVRVDQRVGVQNVIEHLVDRGRRHFAFIGSDASVSTSWERQVAFSELAAAVDPVAPVRVLGGDFSAEWGREATRKILAVWPEVDAIVCANDLIALGAIQTLELERDRHLSGDLVAVSGFDDTLIASANRITSVRQPLDELAARAMQISGNAGRTEPAEQVVLQPSLVIRASTDV